MVVSGERLVDLQRALDEALGHLALGRLDKGQNALKPIEKLSGPERDFLKRDPQRAQKLFDTCVARAQLLWRDKQRDFAKEQMLECVDSFPGFHPPHTSGEQYELFEAARARVNQRPHGSLEVSAPRSCAVRVFGIEVGRSPMTLDSLPVGPIEVQVECERGVPGRRHPLNVVPGVNRIVVDPRFDSVLQTSSVLALAYPNERARNANMDSDSSLLERVLGAHVLLLVMTQTASNELALRVRVHPSKDLGVMRYIRSTGFARTQLEAVIRSLHPPPPQPDETPPHPDVSQDQLSPARLVTESSTSPPNNEQSDRALPTAIGVAAGVLGLGSLIASWTFYVARENYRQRAWSEVDAGVVNGFEGRGTAALWLGIGSSTFSVTAEYLLLPYGRDVPTAAWFVGGAGVVTAAIGLAYSISGSHCGPLEYSPGASVARECLTGTADVLFGPMLLLTSAPLLNVPLTYLLRSLFAAPPESLSVTPTDITLRISF